VPIHIGSLIQQEVERKRLTYKEFGALIHRNEKTIPDIYDRQSMSTDLLITISQALKIDFFNIYYSEEPLKSLRNDEVARLNSQVQNFTGQIQRLTEEVKHLQKELVLTNDLNDALKEIISFAKEQIEQYKLKLPEISPCQKDANQSH
jgi:predicted  nucleic acid-binding Zn-ribbon protein